MLNKEQQELAARNEYNFDHPDAFDFELLISVLRKLKKGKSIKVPVYDFTSHCRRKEWVRAPPQQTTPPLNLVLAPPPLRPPPRSTAAHGQTDKRAAAKFFIKFCRFEQK